jgi:hypothetical protein
LRQWPWLLPVEGREGRRELHTLEVVTPWLPAVSSDKAMFSTRVITKHHSLGEFNNGYLLPPFVQEVRNPRSR